jgi:signal transduction histidine kinase
MALLLSDQPLWAMISAADVERLQISVGQAIARRERWRDEFRITTASGRDKWIRGEAVPRQGAEELSIHIGIFVEISDRVAAEAIAQQQANALEQTLRELQRTQTQMVHAEKMSSLGQLVAGIAHEINNPVNFIHGNVDHAEGYVQDLLDLIQLYQKYYPKPTPEIQAKIEGIEVEFITSDLTKLLRSMKMGTERIRGIVLSLRNFSRLDESEKKAVDLHDGIESTLLILQNRIKAKSDRAEIEIVKEYGSLPLVECYPGQLNQVFMNILVNAIDALEDALKNEEFNPAISISTQLIENQRVAIAIKDNAGGISAAIQQRLFDPFFTTKPVGKGTGMGLSISYQIVTERHQGTLRCQSAIDQGTQFMIEIPVRPQ